MTRYKSWRRALIALLVSCATVVFIPASFPQASPLTKTKDIITTCADPSFEKFCTGLFTGYIDMYLEATMMTNKNPYFCAGETRGNISNSEIISFVVNELSKNQEMHELRAVVAVRRLIAEFFGCEPPPM